MAVFTALTSALVGAGMSTLMAGISVAALQVAAGIAINYFVSSFNGQTEQQYPGMQGQLQVGADVSRTVPIGLGLADTSLAYANYWGADGKTPNAYLTQVICAGDYPVKGLAEIYIDGVKEEPLWSEATEMGAPLAGKRRDGKDHAWLKFYDGAQLAADPWLVAKFGTHPERPYSASRVGTGCPYFILTTKVNEELWTGFPAAKVVLNGARLYDISKDSTRGGVGSQRIGLPNTWGGDGDDLPAVQAYALMTGFRVNGQWLYGLQNLPLAQLPNDWWVSQINACRDTVQGPNGLEPQYRSGGSLRVSQPISEAVTNLATACQGRRVEVGGEYRFHVGVAQTPVYHITDGDVFSTKERSFAPFVGLASTINAVAANHPSPENGWNTLPLPTLLRPDLEVKDGNRRLLTSVNLDLVPYEWQGQRIMASALAEARRERKLALPLSGAFYRALPGEWITFTSPANGFVNKTFRIDGVVDLDDGHVLWDITEIEPADYTPNFGTYVPPVQGAIEAPVIPAQTIVSWSIAPDSIKDQDGVARRPSVRFNWDPDIEDVRAVGFQLKVAATDELILDESFDNVRAGTANLASARIINEQDLLGRGRYYSSSGAVPQTWTGWLPVSTLPIGLSGSDLAPDLSNLLNETRVFIDEQLPTINLQLGELDEQLVDLGIQVEAIETSVAVSFQQVNDALSIVEAQVADILGSAVYDAAKAYEDGDVVKFEGGLYLATQDVPIGTAPTNAAYWQKIGDYDSLGEAVAATANLLTSELARVDGTLSSQSNALIALNNAISDPVTGLPSKASVTTVNALSNTVTQQGNTLTAQGDALTSVQAGVASIGASGSNLLIDTYSWLTSTVAPPLYTNVTTTTASVVAESAAPSGFAYRLVRTGTAETYMGLGQANTTATRNLDLVPGTYIVSASVRSPSANKPTVRPRLFANGITGGTTSTQPTTSTRTRMSWEITIVETVRVHVLWYMSGGSAGDEVIIDSVMVERKAGTGTNSAPSPFVAGPSAASVATTAAAVTSLGVRVTANEQGIALQGSAITALQNALPGKADASALNDLTTTVTQQGTTLNSQGQAITALQNALPGKADVSALDALGTTVTQQGTLINAQGNALTAVQAKVGNQNADTNFVRNALFLTSGELSGVSNAAQTVTYADAATLPVPTPAPANQIGVFTLLNTPASNTLRSFPFMMKNDLNEMPVMPGDRVVASVDMYVADSTETHNFLMFTRLHVSGSATNDRAARYNYALGGWQRLTHEYTVLPDFKGIRLGIGIDAGAAGSGRPGAGAKVYFANPVLQRLQGAAAVQASAQSALGARVTNNEGALTSQADAITALQGAVGDKADASAVTALATRLTDNEAATSAQGTAITAVQATLNGIGGQGVNLLPEEWSRIGPNSVIGNLLTSTALLQPNAASAGGYEYAITSTTTSNTSRMALVVNLTDKSMEIKPGTYIVSFKGRASVDGHLVRMQFNGASGATGANIALTTTDATYSFPITVTTSGPVVVLFRTNVSAVAGRTVYAYDFMIERKEGNSDSPSAFTPGYAGNRADGQAAAQTAPASRVTNTENTQTAQGQSITNINANLAGISGGGANLVPAEYGYISNLANPPVTGVGQTITFPAYADSPSGYAIRGTMTVADNTPRMYLAASAAAADGNIMLEPGTYIISYFCRGTSGQRIRAGFWDGTTEYMQTTAYVTQNSGSVKRNHGEFTIPGTAGSGNTSFVKGCVVLQDNLVPGAVGTSTNIWGVMIEKKIGAQTAPSTYVDGPSGKSVASKAEASAVSSLAATVTAQGNELEAQANSVDLLAVSYGDLSASGLFSVSTKLAPSGVSSRIALASRATAAGATAEAAMLMDAKVVGGVLTSEILWVAGRIALVATDATGAAKHNLLVVDGSGVFIDNARMKGLTADNIDVTNLLASNAFIENLLVDRLQIKNGAVTDSGYVSQNYTVEGSRPGQPQQPYTVNGPVFTAGNQPVLMVATISQPYHGSGDSTAITALPQIYCVTDNTTESFIGRGIASNGQSDIVLSKVLTAGKEYRFRIVTSKASTQTYNANVYISNFVWYK